MAMPGKAVVDRNGGVFTGQRQISRRAFVGAATATGVTLVTGLPRGIVQGFLPTTGPGGVARNVIFMLGDGMGRAQRDAGQLFTVGPYDRLAMDTLPVTGFVGTNSVDAGTFITDSAAAATALATGVKTLNGAIGVDARGERVNNLIELAKDAGKSVGLVTTSRVSDASPAAFAAHVLNRDYQREIARQYIEETAVDVILGGGKDRWLPKGAPADADELNSSDKDDLIARARALGYAYVRDAAGLASAAGPKLLGLFADEKMFRTPSEGKEGRYDPVVSLERMVTKAIEILSHNPNGFFLFAEEEAIDEMAHANEASLMLKGVRALDKAVAVALDFSTSNPDTLLLVTGDHETGGLAIEAGQDAPFPVANSDYAFKVDWTTGGHTGMRIPLTAAGPGAEALAGHYENTEVFVAILRAMGIELSAGIPATPDFGTS